MTTQFHTKCLVQDSGAKKFGHVPWAMVVFTLRLQVKDERFGRTIPEDNVTHKAM